jgi:hypothetical protein
VQVGHLPLRVSPGACGAPRLSVEPGKRASGLSGESAGGRAIGGDPDPSLPIGAERRQVTIGRWRRRSKAAMTVPRRRSDRNGERLAGSKLKLWCVRHPARSLRLARARQGDLGAIAAAGHGTPAAAVGGGRRRSARRPAPQTRTRRISADRSKVDGVLGDERQRACGVLGEAMVTADTVASPARASSDAGAVAALADENPTPARRPCRRGQLATRWPTVADVSSLDYVRNTIDWRSR